MAVLNPSHTDALREVLKSELSRSQEARFLQRLHCVLLVSKGCDPGEVGRWFGVHSRTVDRWIAQYAERGVVGLRDRSNLGRPPRLGEKQRQALQTQFSSTPREFGYDRDVWDGRLVQTHLAGRFGVKLSLRQCQRLVTQWLQD